MSILFGRKLFCQECGRSKGVIKGKVISWNRCPNCGVICPKCTANNGIIRIGGKRCPKCGRRMGAIR